MKRRRVLRALSAGSALVLAGCLADDSAGGDADTVDDTDTPTGAGETDEPSDGTATDSSGTDAGTPSDGSDSTAPATPGRAGDASFSVTNSTCGNKVDEATVSFGDGVTVSGTIWGNDSCYTAKLRGTSSDAGSLTVTVAAVDDSDPNQACMQCITEIEYEASVPSDGDGPDEVVVVHVHGDERKTVTTAQR